MTARILGFSGKSHVSLGKQMYVAGQTISFKIPQDIVVKEFIIIANGAITPTFAGAKPGVNPYGILNGLINEMSLSRRGTDRVRSYKGTRQLVHTLERQFGQMDGTKYKVNSADLSGVCLQGLPVWGTTTQSVAFRESITMMMENKLSGAWFPTYFNTKGLQTGQINISFNPLSAIQDPIDSAVVASYATSGIEIEIFASCADYALDDAKIGFADWNQNYEELEFSGAQVNSRKYITPQNNLQGILISGTHSNGKPFDFETMRKTKIEIRYQGTALAEGSMADYLEIDAVKTMLTSQKQGSCYLSFLNNGSFESALFIAEGKQLELIITTDSSLSYASPVKLIFEYDSVQGNGKVATV